MEHIRKATWLELFFDLIFVVAISKAAHVLLHVHHGHIEPVTYFKYILIMVPVSWAWTGHTLFADRFDCEDIFQRLMTLLQMFCAIVMSVYISTDFDANYHGFLLSYVAMRVLTVLMYARASLLHPKTRHVSNYIGIAFALGAAVSMSSMLFEGAMRYVVLYAGIIFEMMVPLAGQKRLSTLPVHSHHLPERFGLMTIILLGESVLSLVHSLEKADWTPEAMAAGICGFILMCGLWWIYFENLERHISGRDLRHGQGVTYPHFFIYLGLGAIAAMIRFAALPELMLADYRVLSLFAVLCFMLTMQFLCFIYHPQERRRHLALHAAIFTASFVALVFAAPSALVILGGTAGLVAGYALLTRVPG